MNKSKKILITESHQNTASNLKKRRSACDALTFYFDVQNVDWMGGWCKFTFFNRRINISGPCFLQSEDLKKGPQKHFRTLCRNSGPPKRGSHSNHEKFRIYTYPKRWAVWIICIKKSHPNPNPQQNLHSFVSHQYRVSTFSVLWIST